METVCLIREMIPSVIKKFYWYSLLLSGVERNFSNDYPLSYVVLKETSVKWQLQADKEKSEFYFGWWWNARLLIFDTFHEI